MSPFWMNFIIQIVTAALGALVQHPLVVPATKLKAFTALETSLKS